MITPLDADWKDWLQAAAWIAAAATLILAIVKFWSELREGRRQRERELRWRQAEVGKDLNDEMQTDPRAWSALQMLDSERRSFDLGHGESAVIDHQDIDLALDTATQSDKVTFIQDCFDSLFYFFAMFDHYISNTLILEEDVAYPIEYYIPLMARHKPQILAYLGRHNLSRAQRFLDRYSIWREAPDPGRTTRRVGG